MAKTRTAEPTITISEHCIICRQIFIKKHPKDDRCICESCAEKIAKLINVSTES